MREFDAQPSVRVQGLSTSSWCVQGCARTLCLVRLVRPGHAAVGMSLWPMPVPVHVAMRVVAMCG